MGLEDYSRTSCLIFSRADKTNIKYTKQNEKLTEFTEVDYFLPGLEAGYTIV